MNSAKRSVRFLGKIVGILALPYRLGGIGLNNPVTSADQAYEMSCGISEDLTNLILRQEPDLRLLVKEKVKTRKGELLQDENSKI